MKVDVFYYSRNKRGFEMFKKSTVFIITLTFTLSLTTSVFATPTKQSLTKQQQQIQEEKNNLNKSMQNSNLSFEDAKKEISSITAQIQSLDSKIEGLTANISESSAKIDAKVIEIKTAEVKLAKNLVDLEKEQAIYNARMRSMYIAGPVQNAKLILASKSLDDFFSNLEAVTYLSKLDKQITEELAATKKSITETKTLLQTQNALLVTANKDLQTKLTNVKASKSTQSGLITEAKRKQSMYSSQITGYKTKIEASNKQATDTENQIKDLVLKEEQAKKAQAAQAASLSAKLSPTRGSLLAPATSNALIAYAYGFMGTTYVWGGTSPSPGFDCSGFLQYVYAHFGVRISRTTYTQINEGKSVGRDQLQPGDLIFFGSYSDPHHVAMYVGNNCIIHAPQTGDVIKISSLGDRSDFLCAKRILN